MRIVDLSIPFVEDSEIKTSLHPDLPVYCGHTCYAYDLQIKSHTGTYFETSAHVFRKGQNTSDIPVSDLVLPGYCMHFSSAEQCITAEHLDSGLGDIAPGSAVLVDTGDNKTKYFSKDAAQWLAEKSVKLMGSNTQRYDTGFVNPTGFFIDLFKAQIPIIAGLKNLDLLPPNGFTLIALPLRIQNICTVPCRVIAVIYPHDSNELHHNSNLAI